MHVTIILKQSNLYNGSCTWMFFSRRRLSSRRDDDDDQWMFIIIFLFPLPLQSSFKALFSGTSFSRKKEIGPFRSKNETTCNHCRKINIAVRVNVKEQLLWRGTTTDISLMWRVLARKIVVFRCVTIFFSPVVLVCVHLVEMIDWFRNNLSSSLSAYCFRPATVISVDHVSWTTGTTQS